MMMNLKDFRAVPHPVRNAFGKVEYAVLALYAAVIAWTIPHHEDWADEAQAWLIAESNSVHDILMYRLHYEGSPPLWHLLLRLLFRLHLPSSSMHWMSALAGLAAAYVALRYAPYPRIVRCLLPFTFFLLYQYVVLARPYVLFPLLLFALCIAFTAQRPRPLLFALVAGLLANLNMHAAVYVCALAMLYLAFLLKRGVQRTRRGLLEIGASVVLFLVMVAAAVAVATPAPNISYVRQGDIAGTLSRYVKPDPHAIAPFAAPDPPLPAGQLQPRDPFPTRAVKRFTSILNLIFYATSNYNLLAGLFFLSFVLWLWSRRALTHLIPTAVIIAFSIKVWVWDHHLGMLLLSMLAAAWIVWRTKDQVRGKKWIEPVFVALFVAILATQVVWSAVAIRDDTRGLYNPSAQTVALLRGPLAGKRVAGFNYESLPIQLLSPTNPFFNQSTRYWSWNKQDDPDRYRLAVLATHPDAVVTAYMGVGPKYILNQLGQRAGVNEILNEYPVLFWEAHGYRTTHHFCGYQFGHMGVMMFTCQDVMEPDPAYDPGTAAK